MIISADAEKATVKVQHQFTVRTLNKVGLEQTHLNRTKALHKKPTMPYSTGKNGELSP